MSKVDSSSIVAELEEGMCDGVLRFVDCGLAVITSVVRPGQFIDPSLIKKVLMRFTLCLSALAKLVLGFCEQSNALLSFVP